jgi:hypothetical protein
LILGIGPFWILAVGYFKPLNISAFGGAVAISNREPRNLLQSPKQKLEEQLRFQKT